MALSNQLLQFIIDEDNYWDDVLITLLSSGLIQMEDYDIRSRIPCRTHPFSGHDMITDILGGHPKRGYNHFRMTNTMFVQLEQLLMSCGLVSSTHNMMAKEQLTFFLYCIRHDVTNRVLAKTFQHSGKTISRYYNKVLKGICSLKHEFIVQPSEDVSVHPWICENNYFHPFFMVQFKSHVCY